MQLLSLHIKKLGLALVITSITMSALASGTDPKKKAAQSSKDTTVQSNSLEQKGFKDLFANDTYNPAKPYTTQINPVVMPFVEDYLRVHEKSLLAMKSWAGPYFTMMDGILASYGLPKELKYLAVIESNLQSTAQSWAGAVGPWQFMPETGRRMGLIITSRYDERRDYYKSTHAAARYLKELYSDLGDWLLVIAAYNGGPGRVTNAIKRSGSHDFWSLQYHLPQESRNHVKKFISTHFIMEGGGGQTTSTKAEWANHQVKMADETLQLQTQIDPQILASTETTDVQGRYNSVVVANALMLDINTFNALNPNFDAMVNGEKGYSLRIPKEKMELFKTNRFNILYQSVILTMQKANNTGVNYPSADAKPTVAKPTSSKSKK
jgi:membrane-bound lytic murein transglycosylase D